MFNLVRLARVLALVLIVSLPMARATDIIETLAGGGSLEGYDPLQANLALGNSEGIAVSAIGEIYVSDSVHNQVLKINPTTAKIMIYAGDGTAAYFGDGTPAVSAGLNNPGGLAFDSKGNLLIVDRGNFVVRQVDAVSYLISTIAGNGMFTGQGTPPAPLGDGGQATQATFSQNMGGIAVSSTGNVLVADSGNNAVRGFTPGGIITTVAGTAGQPGAFAGDGAAATSARLANPTGITIDSSGNLFISDSGNRRVREVDTSGNINTVVGTGAGGGGGFSGDGAPPLTANIGSLGGLAFDSSKRLVISCVGANRIRRADLAGNTIETIGGNGGTNPIGDLGPATAAALSAPRDVALDSSGNIYIYDSGNERIRRIDAATGFITTVIGTGNVGQNGDRGPRQFIVLVDPQGATFDGNGNLYIADTGDNAVRKVGTDGTVTTFAGTGSPNGLGDGNPANLANISNPTDVLFVNNTILIADNGHNRIRAVNFSSNGNLMTTYAQIADPTAMVADSTGNVYVTSGNGGNNAVAIIRTDFSVNFFIGNAPKGTVANPLGDGLVAGNGVLSNPSGLCLSASGDIYIADTGNNRIRLVHNNIITTFAGGGTNTAPSVGDGGLATAATLSAPVGVTLDPTGTKLIIADSGNHRIRSVDLTTNIITTISGNGIAGFNGDGDVAASAQVNDPTHIFVNGGGLVFADTGNNRVRKIITAIDIAAGQLSFSAKLTFAKDKKTNDLQEGKDSVQLKAGLPLPAGIKAANLPISVDVVDLHQSVQLDANGKQPKAAKPAKKPKTAKSTLADTLAAKAPKAPKGGTVAPSFSFTPSTGETIADSKFQLSLKGTSAAGGKPTSFSFSSKGSFDEELGRAGFSNVTTAKDGVNVTLRIDITLGTTVFTGTTMVNYKASQGKNGSAKSTKK
jgi:sugar lactone lactonase YvrE